MESKFAFPALFLASLALILSGCLAPSGPVCGDNICEPPTENQRTCPQDCTQTKPALEGGPAFQTNASADTTEQPQTKEPPTKQLSPPTAPQAYPEETLSYPCAAWLASAVTSPEAGTVSTDDQGNVKPIEFKITGSLSYTGDCIGKRTTITSTASPKDSASQTEVTVELSSDSKGTKSALYTLGPFVHTGARPEAECIKVGATTETGGKYEYSPMTAELGVGGSQAWCNQYMCNEDAQGNRTCQTCDLTTTYVNDLQDKCAYLDKNPESGYCRADKIYAGQLSPENDVCQIQVAAIDEGPLAAIGDYCGYMEFIDYQLNSIEEIAGPKPSGSPAPSGSPTQITESTPGADPARDAYTKQTTDTATENSTTAYFASNSKEALKVLITYIREIREHSDLSADEAVNLIELQVENRARESFIRGKGTQTTGMVQLKRVDSGSLVYVKRLNLIQTLALLRGEAVDAVVPVGGSEFLSDAEETTKVVVRRTEPYRSEVMEKLTKVQNRLKFEINASEYRMKLYSAELASAAKRASVVSALAGEVCESKWTRFGSACVSAGKKVGRWLVKGLAIAGLAGAGKTIAGEVQIAMSTGKESDRKKAAESIVKAFSLTYAAGSAVVETIGTKVDKKITQSQEYKDAVVVIASDIKERYTPEEYNLTAGGYVRIKPPLKKCMDMKALRELEELIKEYEMQKAIENEKASKGPPTK